MKYTFILFLFLLTKTISSQENTYLIDTAGINFEEISSDDIYLMDSLLPLVQEATHDTTRLRHLAYLVENCWDDNIWPKYNSLVLSMADRNLPSLNDSIYISYKARAINNIGYMYDEEGKVVLALENYKSAVSLFEKIEEQKGILDPLNNLALIYKSLGDVDKALDYYYRCLDVVEKTGYENDDLFVYNNLGGLYIMQGDFPTAKKYYHKTLELAAKHNDIRLMATGNVNLAGIHKANNELDSALLFYQKSYELRSKLGTKTKMANSLVEIGNIHFLHNNNDTALSYYLKAFNLINELENAEATNHVHYALGRVYLKTGEVEKAVKVTTIAHKYAVELGYLNQIKLSAELLSDIYKKLNEYDKALEMYQLSITMRDSLINEQNQRAVYRAQINYEFEQKENESKLKEQKKELIQAQEEKKKNIIITAISIGMSLAVLFLIYIYSRFRVIKKQKQLIEDQKRIVDHQKEELINFNDALSSKNDQITDSISYAKKIQKAVLPSQVEFSKIFPDSFIHFMPKDVVSGDFHWFHQQGDLITFTVADCTGHGVPGAFMSIIGNNLLDKIVINKKITQPDLILDSLNIELNARMNKDTEEGLGDGMDLAICSIHLKTMKLQFSGAHNPMYLLRNKEIIEFKGDKLHLGNLVHTEGKSFQLHEFDLQKEDILYFFSDGYADQKGGEKGKKFYYPVFRKLLIENSDKSMKEQEEVLAKTMFEWKGDIPQMDDILVIGVKF